MQGKALHRLRVKPAGRIGLLTAVSVELTIDLSADHVEEPAAATILSLGSNAR